ncbi:hypothetical protein [Haloglomus litoreum]|uniref:hypothetical protein n=1 Tax=Haloglomus litoreum TaxID=3034026 RepID=UPI0023E7C70E|nr:hypothetical protein [Haloglomus sp. DT116]
MEGLRRRAGLVLIAVGVVLLATATYGFSSIAADRTVDVGTTPDSGAYLGITESGAGEVNVSRSPSPDVLDLTNNFEGDLSRVSVAVASTDGTAVGPADLEATGPQSIAVGATGSVSLQCASDSDAEEDAVTVTVEITATGEGVSVETSEAVTLDVDCKE